MFAVKLEASQERPIDMSGDCRRDYPDRPSAPLQESQGYMQYPVDPYVATSEMNSNASPNKSAGRGILKDKSPIKSIGRREESPLSNPTGNRVKIATESSQGGSTLKKGR